MGEGGMDSRPLRVGALLVALLITSLALLGSSSSSPARALSAPRVQGLNTDPERVAMTDLLPIGRSSGKNIRSSDKVKVVPGYLKVWRYAG